MIFWWKSLKIYVQKIVSMALSIILLMYSKFKWNQNLKFSNLLRKCRMSLSLKKMMIKLILMIFVTCILCWNTKKYLFWMLSNLFSDKKGMNHLYKTIKYLILIFNKMMINSYLKNKIEHSIKKYIVGMMENSREASWLLYR